jgi:hypothetical protein
MPKKASDKKVVDKKTGDKKGKAKSAEEDTEDTSTKVLGRMVPDLIDLNLIPRRK